MPFGAFAEIIPGVDGLIHISQITDHRIGLPSEVLNEGMNVDVKIIDIDQEKCKISLSIRALMTPESAQATPEQEQAQPQAEDTTPPVESEADSPPEALPAETE